MPHHACFISLLSFNILTTCHSLARNLVLSFFVAGDQRSCAEHHPAPTEYRRFLCRLIYLQVASIPRRVCFSSDAKDAPAGTLRAWAHDLVATTPQFSKEALALEVDVALVTLQVFLERAAGARSAFAPWMALLRGRDHLNLPALWPASDLEALEGTLVQQEIEACLARAEMERDVVAAAISERFGGGEEHGRACCWLDPEGMEGRPTLSEWLHARCTVQSRAYRVGRRYAKRHQAQGGELGCDAY